MLEESLMCGRRQWLIHVQTETSHQSSVSELVIKRIMLSPDSASSAWRMGGHLGSSAASEGPVNQSQRSAQDSANSSHRGGYVLVGADWPEGREVQSLWSFWLFFFTSCFIWLEYFNPASVFEAVISLAC